MRIRGPMYLHDLDDGPEATARAFLSALNAGDWNGTAALVHPGTVERFREWIVEQLGREDDGEAPDESGDTEFFDARSLLGMHDVSEAEALTPTELLARFAAAVGPRAIERMLCDSDPALFLATRDCRVVRTFLACRREGGDRAHAEYRTEWYFAGRQNQTMGGTHVLQLALSADAWRVLDADLSGHGTGHILPPTQR